MLKHLVVGERRVGDGGKQARCGTRGPRVLSQPHRLVRAQRADANENRRARPEHFEGDVERAPSFGARKVRVGAGAAEQPDRADLCGRERLKQAAERRAVDLAVGFAGRDREGR